MAADNPDAPPPPRMPKAEPLGRVDSDAPVRSKWITHVVTQKISSVHQCKALGWGEGAGIASVMGSRPMNICIERDNKTLLSIHITEEGQLTITDHGHSCYQIQTGQLTMSPVFPWPSDKK